MIKSFVEVELESLIPETTLGLNLYILRGSEYLLYCMKTLPFSEEKRQTLLQSGVHQVYIESGDATKFQDYIESNIDTIISNPEISTEKKSKIVYTASTTLMEKLFSNPRSGEKLLRSKNIIRGTVDLILGEEKATSHLVSLSAFDYHIFSHCVNVMIFGLALCEKILGKDSPYDFYEVGMGLLMHDLGMSKIDPAILNKEGQLRSREWQIMKLHPEYGISLLKESGEISEEVQAIVLEHHEKYDGEGYPRGLVGEEIHILARIASMANVFDALTTRKPYREPKTTFEALKIMNNEMQNHFDPQLFKDFIMVFQ